MTEMNVLLTIGAMRVFAKESQFNVTMEILAMESNTVAEENVDLENLYCAMTITSVLWTFVKEKLENVDINHCLTLESLVVLIMLTVENVDRVDMNAEETVV